LLAFARRQELKTQAVDVPELVRGMTGLLQRVLGPSIQIDTRFPLGLAPALSDLNQLETALLNLAVNSRDAMPAGGTITIEAQSEKVGPRSESGLATGDYIRLSVADTGEGMDAASLARATEPFFTTKGVGKGTGLGLSMVHGLAEQSGGLLALRSIPGEGTTVDLWLPRAVAGDEQDVSATLSRSVSEHVDPIVILAVDDDGLVLMNAVAMLEDLGHRAASALSAKDALAILGREKVDLVITDYAMPHVTGLQLAEAIRATHPALPVIVATGYAELPPDISFDLLRLSKPYTQHDLAKAIGRISDEGGFARRRVQ
jgi:CheY-like chemotaxis protein